MTGRHASRSPRKSAAAHEKSRLAYNESIRVEREALMNHIASYLRFDRAKLEAAAKEKGNLWLRERLSTLKAADDFLQEFEHIGN